MSYDYTVLAGTQGMRNHRKKDRLFELAERRRLPVVLFAEGGGGRPGRHRHADRRRASTAAPSTCSRALSGLVPLVGIASGCCFAGNAALLGCCDVVIATEDSNIGMGGPAMIEGGGLGVFAPEEIGPIDVQDANGVVDVRVADEAEAVARRQALPVLLPGPGRELARAPTSALLRDADPREPPARLRRARGRSTALVDDGLGARAARAASAPGMVTALARVEGRPLGVVANNPHAPRRRDRRRRRRQGRALPAAVRRVRPAGRCSCATRPASWSGPTAEATATVRHFARMFVDRRQPDGAVRHDRAAQGLRPRRAGDGRRQLQGAAVHRRAGRPASSAGWASRARCGSGMRRELEAIEDAGRARARLRGDGRRAPTSTARRSTWPPTSRSTT